MDEQGGSSLVWHKSTYSGGSGECIEVAGTVSGFIAIRDSKNADGPELTFALTEWVKFMSRLKGN